MKSDRSCCSSSEGRRVCKTHGVCFGCYRAMRQPRKKPTPHAAFEYAIEYAVSNVRGARRLAAWAITVGT